MDSYILINGWVYVYRQPNPSYATGAEILQDAHYLDLGDYVEVLVGILTVSLGFAGYVILTYYRQIDYLKDKLQITTDNALFLQDQLQKKKEHISNLQKTNALLQAKVTSQEQKIKKISQFFAK